MAVVCTTVTERIQTEISKPVEEWEEEQQKKCKKHKWYDPRGWLCWFVLVSVKVFRWVVVTVVTAVFTLVCRLVSDLIDIFVHALKFLGLVLKALFTWDKCSLQAAIAELGNVVGGSLTLVGDVLIRPIIDRVQTYRLRNYVKGKIAERYAAQPDVIPVLNDLFCVDHGVFGYRLTCTVYRMYVDSRTMTSVYGDVPNLFALHDDKKIDLYALAGFNDGCAIFSKEGWYRPRHQTATFPFASGGGGSGPPTPPELKKEALDEYISSRGQSGPHFRIYAISPGHLDLRLDAAKEKGRQLGLILDFKQEDKEVTDPQYINYERTPVNEVKTLEQLAKFLADGFDRCLQWNGDARLRAPWNKGQIDYLICQVGRQPKSDYFCCSYGSPPVSVSGSLETALSDLCSPVAVCVFGFTDKITRGLTNNLIGTTDCPPADVPGIIGTTPPLTDKNDVNLSPDIASGVSFIDDMPDELRKYVLIHELGHYFGLCHVSGFDRLMVSGKQGQGYTFSIVAVGNTLLHGGPRFIYTEAQRVWKFVLTNFPLECFIPRDPQSPPEPSEPIFL
jgi:hypothetical protein